MQKSLHDTPGYGYFIENVSAFRLTIKNSVWLQANEIEQSYLSYL